MPLVVRIGYDTIQRLEQAALQRFEEAEILHNTGKNLAGVYLHGYVAEMMIKSAYYRMIGIGYKEKIDSDRRKRLNGSARTKIEKDISNGDLQLFDDVWPDKKIKDELMKIEKSHPIFGFALLLRDEMKKSDRSGLRDKVSSNATVIRRNWDPTLRYRVVKPNPKEIREVRTASKWFLDHHTEFSLR